MNQFNKLVKKPKYLDVNFKALNQKYLVNRNFFHK